MSLETTKFAIGVPLPFVAYNKNPQTKASIGLRTTIEILSAGVITVGFLAVFASHLPVIGAIGNIGGWSMVGGGGLTALAAAAVKRVKIRNNPKASQSTQDPTQHTKEKEAQSKASEETQTYSTKKDSPPSSHSKSSNSKLIPIMPEQI